MKWWALIGLIAVSVAAEAKIYRNAYLETVLPDTWTCFQDNTAHICRSPDERKGSEAIMIINARLRSPQDNLDEFRTLLSQRRTIYDVRNSPLQSTVYSTRDRQLNGHTWIESTQFNSEIPNFYSFYYATVHETWDAAVLINFNVHQRSADAYRAMISDIVTNVKFLSPPADYARTVKAKKETGSATALAKAQSPRTTASTIPWPAIVLGALVAGLVGYLFLSRNQ